MLLMHHVCTRALPHPKSHGIRSWAFEGALYLVYILPTFR